MSDYPKGYNVDFPEWSDLSDEEKSDVVRLLLEVMKCRIWRDRTPDYTEIRLVDEG